MTCTLQINTHGAWRNVLAFEAEREAEIIVALKPLARAVPLAGWCVLYADGRRNWLLPRAKPGPECDPSDLCAGCRCDYAAE